MPTGGFANGTDRVFCLGFAASIPQGYAGLLLPRSGVGSRYGLELNNTCGVIDADYRGEWMASLRTKSGLITTWEKGDRVIQCVVVPTYSITPVLVDELDSTERGEGGFGSSGK